MHFAKNLQHMNSTPTLWCSCLIYFFNFPPTDTFCFKKSDFTSRKMVQTHDFSEENFGSKALNSVSTTLQMSIFCLLICILCKEITYFGFFFEKNMHENYVYTQKNICARRFCSLFIVAVAVVSL